MKYRKLPVEIEAVQWGYNSKFMHETPQWIIDALYANNGDMEKAGTICRMGDQIHISTLEGIMICSPGDYIIKGVNGELYPCKPEIFAKTYEKVI